MSPGPGAGVSQADPSALSPTNAYTPHKRESLGRSQHHHRSSIQNPSQSVNEGVCEMQHIAEGFKDFLIKQEGSALRAWLRHFDQNNDQKISLTEFMRGMRKLNYQGDIPTAFSALDRDHSGELSLEEIDHFQSVLWRHFRQFCVERFDGPDDMLDRLARQVNSTTLDMSKFIDGLRQMGWTDGSEELIYNSLDVDNLGELKAHHLRWLEIDKRRQKRKEQAKRKAKELNEKKRGGVHDRKAVEQAFAEFKVFLKRKYGHFVRAWRRILSPDGSLNLHKTELFKACSQIGWLGDVRLLWAAFDKDGSGEVSIEELDPQGAELLAHFKKFVVERFGNMTAAFRALDRFNMKKLRRPEFLNAVKGFGFQFPAKTLFAGLDLDGTKSIVEEDLYFLDRWRPPAFLVAQPNRQAADELKALLRDRYKNFLKAWRHCLDLDGSNRCAWNEFNHACKRVGFEGDVAGAWRVLDDDLSGYISLAEIDSDASKTLGNFKAWADEEFGGVRSAFTVFDGDGSNEVSYREFRRTCRAYGFNSEDVKLVFQALDVEKNGALSVEEVMFLDDWEFACDPCRQIVEQVEEAPSAKSSQFAHDSNCTRYETEGPGPALIAQQSTVGVGPTTPMLRFSGAFSFRRRPQVLPGIPKDITPSPADYAAGSVPFSETVARSKPAWVFGSAPRQLNVVKQSTPGPGQYGAHLSLDSRHSQHGPAAICSPRRPIKVHPLFQRHGEPSARPFTTPWTAR